MTPVEDYCDGSTQWSYVKGCLVGFVVTVALSAIVHKLLWKGLWIPLRYRRIMAKQGVKGPPFRFLVGQLHEMWKYRDSFPDAVPLDSYADLSPTVTPQYALFFPKFPGEKYFLYWWGKSSRLVVRDPEIAKEVFITNHASMRRILPEDPFLTRLIGKGVLLHTGEKWVIERRTISPFFHHDALKGMVEAMVEGTQTEMHKWEQMVAQGGGSAEIDMEPDVHKISGRILSLTAFSGDYERGVTVYELQKEIASEYYKMIRSIGFWLIPRYRDIPTKKHRYMNKMASKIDALLLELINGRLEAVRNGEANSYGNDLLGRMLKAAGEGWNEEKEEFNLASVLNNCKLFYFAGQDTVANAILYMMLMLALHPTWQDRARQEVMEVVGDEEHVDFGVLSHLKVVEMVAKETLRCFSPAPVMTRSATTDLQLEKLFIPKGLTIEFAITAVHQDKEYWGEDVAEFNPERFANGVSAACSHPQAFVPFGLGPKFCVGNNFAMMEMKIIVSRVLRRFQLLPSPNYQHHPTTLMALIRPKHGMPIILKAL
ncbi:hypothetical protein M758_9G067300 [Ceratodon purpureus]|nr:hypothetical protein M758_9G067300 [Ceratodon purpureus]